MTEQGSEYSIPYEEIVPLLIDGGFDGYMSSEYEATATSRTPTRSTASSRSAASTLCSPACST